MSLDDFFDDVLTAPLPGPQTKTVANPFVAGAEAKPVDAPGVPDPVDAVVADYFHMSRQAAHGNMMGALDANPDNAGKAATIADATGSPFAVVEQDLKTHDDLAQLKRNKLIVSKNGALASWLADDFRNARIAKDDFDKLDVVSKGIDALSTGWSGAFVYNERLREQARKEFGMDKGADYISALDKRLADNPKMSGVYGALQTASGFAGGLLDSVFRSWDETAAGAGIGAALGGGLTAEAGGVGAVPGAIAGAGIGFGVGFNTDQSLIAAGEFYLNTEKVVGENGEALDPAARHAAAALVFLGSYALNSLGLKTVGKSASAALSEAVEQAVTKPTIARALAQFGTGMAKASLEGAAIFSAMAGTQVFAEEFAKQFSEGDFATLFNDETVRNEAVMRLISAAAMGAIAMPFLKLPFEGTTLATDMLRARQAQSDVAVLQGLEKGAVDSKTRARNLDAFRRFVSSQTDGSPIENISIPGAKVLELYQSIGVEPGKEDGVFGSFVDDIKEQIEQAKETGGDVVIPLSGYITHLAGSDIAKAIQNDLRLRPEGMTLNEAEAYAKDRGAMLEANAVDWQFALDNVFAHEDPAKQVYDDVFTKLRQAGHTIDAATQYATLVASRYRTRAERIGGIQGDAWEMYKAEGLEIKRELPTMLRRVKVDNRDVVIEALRRGDKMPSDRALFGPTVLEFIKAAGGVFDERGELKARDMGKVKGTKGVLRDPKKGGRKTDHGLDEMGLKLFEAGYFPDRPTINEILEAIDEELAGNRRYQFGTDREAEAMFRDAVDDLEDFLGRNNIDLKTTTNAAIKRALTQFEKQATKENREFAQPAYHGSPHVFDRFTLDHIGKGEGAQAYGWGLYFASTKAVAKFYREQLSESRPITSFKLGSIKFYGDGRYGFGPIDYSPRYDANDPKGHSKAVAKAVFQERVLADEQLIREEFERGGVDKARLHVEGILDDLIDDVGADPEATAYYRYVRSNIEQGIMKFDFKLGEPQGRLYEVELQPKTADWLDWDKALHEQSPKVKKALKAAGLVSADDLGKDRDAGEFAGQKVRGAPMTGEEFYKRLVAAHSKDTKASVNDHPHMRDDGVEAMKRASLALHAAGVPGIRYLDGATRFYKGGKATIKKTVAADGGETFVASIKAPRGAHVSALMDSPRFNTKADAEQWAKDRIAGAHNFVVFNDADVVIKSFEQSERGKINLSTGKAVITLFKDANLSTFLHESGHLWLDEMTRDYLAIAADKLGPEGGDVGATLSADFETVLKWMGVETPSQIKVEHHEKFARAFEAYLMEGKAPSTSLARAFRAFKQWLVRIYREVVGLNAPISDEMRGVFDRLIATDEEISQVRDREGLNPVFATPADAGMTQAEFDAYTRKVAKAQEDADSALLQKTMATIRAQRTKEWQDEYAVVREETKSVVTSRPDLRAEYWLRTGRSLNGSELPAGLEHARISREALARMFGNDQTFKMLPHGTTQIEGGLHPDDAAVLFGYHNGDDLVKALMSLEATRMMEQATIGRPLSGSKYVTHLIDQAAQEKMLERHGDALNDGSIEEEAIAAVHNKAQAEVMAIELKAIAKRLGRAPLDLSDIKAWVGEQIALMPVPRATNNAAFLRHEGAAGRDVQRALLKGDFRNAFILKQRQLVNHLMVAASKEAKEDFDAAMKLFTRYATKQKFPGLEQGYVDQLHALLKRMGYPTKRQDAELSGGLAGVGLREFVEGKSREGFDLIVADFLLDPLWSKRPKEMTMDELRGAQDAMISMIHSARIEKTIELEGKRAEFQAVKDEALAQVDQLPTLADDTLDKAGAAIRSPQVSTDRMDAMRAKTFTFKTALRQVGSALRKIEELVDILDAAAPTSALGVFNRVVFKPIADAQHKANDMRTAITLKWLALRDAQSKAWKEALGGKRITLPELKRKDGRAWSMTKSELLMVALNMGNDSNLAKMLKGELWEEGAVKTVLARHLTEEDWRFVQASWDIVNSLWPEIDAHERRLTGIGPDKVEARVVETPFGNLPGGYFPIMYDARLSPDVEARARAAASKLFDEDYQRASTPRGHTKKRVEDYARPIDYSFGRIAAHLESVIHDLSFREPVMQASRFVGDKDIRAAIVSVIGKENYDQFMPWLKHIANEKAIDQRGLQYWDGMAKKARINATAVGLGFRASTMLMQISGFSDSAEMIGAKGVRQGFTKAFGFASPLEAISATLRGVSTTKVGKAIGAKYLAQGFDAIAGNPRKFEAARDFVLERSGEMRHRMDSLDRDIKQGLEELMGKKGALNEARRFAYYGIAMMDQAVTIPTWIGAHAKALAEGKGDVEAAFYADKVVRLSQGAGSAKDLAAVQRSHNEWFKLTTMFYSYMNHVVNRQFAIARQAKSGAAAVRAGDFKAARKDFAMVLARSWWLLVVPPLMSNLLVGRGPEDGEDIASWCLRKIFFNLFGGVPIARDVANIAERKVAGLSAPDFKLSPAETIVDSFGRSGNDAWNATFGDKPVSDKWLKHTIETSGYVFGLPGAGQAGTSAQYLWDVAEGDQKPEDAGEFVGSVLFGPPKKDH